MFSMPFSDFRRPLKSSQALGHSDYSAYCLVQDWRAHGTRVQSGTRDDCAWHVMILRKNKLFVLQNQ